MAPITGSRNQRRLAVARERKAIVTGKWEPFERIELPQGFSFDFGLGDEERRQ